MYTYMLDAEFSPSAEKAELLASWPDVDAYKGTRRPLGPWALARRLGQTGMDDYRDVLP